MVRSSLNGESESSQVDKSWMKDTIVFQVRYWDNISTACNRILIHVAMGRKNMAISKVNIEKRLADFLVERDGYKFLRKECVEEAEI